MNLKRSTYGCLSALCGAICLAQPAGALNDIPPGVGGIILAAATAPAAPIVLATQSLDAQPRSATGARSSAAKPSGSTGRQQSATPNGGRGSKPVHTTVAPGGPERPGYVHYFLLTLPDESLETLVGIEMPGRKIAWSFPDLGVVISPLVEKGVVPAGGREYGVAHLYGIRPFPDDGAMNALRGELANRVGRWVAAGTPYCDNDGPRSTCMSCLGFVLRVLFPGRRNDFPDLPGDFGRALHAKSYSTEDLLLYLTGMMDLPGREARLKRVSQLGLPDALREDVLELVDAMDASPVPQTAAQKAPASRPSNISTRPAQRKRL